MRLKHDDIQPANINFQQDNSHMTREQEIRQHVIAEHNYIWDAYDQGRWAHATGRQRDDNPHLPGHVNASDWTRGWAAEAARHEDLCVAAYVAEGLGEI